MNNEMTAYQMFLVDGTEIISAHYTMTLAILSVRQFAPLLHARIASVRGSTPCSDDMADAYEITLMRLGGMDDAQIVSATYQDLR